MLAGTKTLLQTNQSGDSNLLLCKFHPSRLLGIVRYACFIHVLYIHAALFRLVGGGHLFVDLCKNAGKEVRYCNWHRELSWVTYSWSLNKEYSWSPTFTGDPPYCTCVSKTHPDHKTLSMPLSQQEYEGQNVNQSLRPVSYPSLI